MARCPRVSNQPRRCPRVLCIVWLGVPRLTWHSVNTDYFIVLRFTCVTASTTAPIAVPNAIPRARCPNAAPSATPTAAPTPTPAPEGRFRTPAFTLEPSPITATSEKVLILVQRQNGKADQRRTTDSDCRWTQAAGRRLFQRAVRCALRNASSLKGRTTTLSADNHTHQ